MDLLNSCLPSPASDEQELPKAKVDKAARQEAAPLKRSVRSNRNNNNYSKFGSVTLRNNNNKKGEFSTHVPRHAV